MYNIMIGRNFI